MILSILAAAGALAGVWLGNELAMRQITRSDYAGYEVERQMMISIFQHEFDEAFQHDVDLLSQLTDPNFRWKERE